MRAPGLLRVALLALIWGSGFLLIKVSLRSFTPVELTFARLALGAVVLTAVLLARRVAVPSGRRLWLHLLAAALLGNAVPYTLFGVAEQTVESNLAGAINATTPLWTLLFATVFRQSRRLAAIQLLGVVLGFAGALLILAPWRSDHAPLPGVLACLAASASYGLGYVYMGRYLTGRDLPAIVLSAGQLVAASGLLALALPFSVGLPGRWRWDAVAALLALGVVGTGLAYVLNYRIIADDGPVLASTVTYLLPVVAVLAGFWVLDEAVTYRLLVGVAVVLVGVGLTRRRRVRPAGATAGAGEEGRAGDL